MVAGSRAVEALSRANELAIQIKLLQSRIRDERALRTRRRSGERKLQAVQAIELALAAPKKWTIEQDGVFGATEQSWRMWHGNIGLYVRQWRYEQEQVSVRAFLLTGEWDDRRWEIDCILGSPSIDIDTSRPLNEQLIELASAGLAGIHERLQRLQPPASVLQSEPCLTLEEQERQLRQMQRSRSRLIQIGVGCSMMARLQSEIEGLQADCGSAVDVAAWCHEVKSWTDWLEIAPVRGNQNIVEWRIVGSKVFGLPVSITKVDRRTGAGVDEVRLANGQFMVPASDTVDTACLAELLKEQLTRVGSDQLQKLVEAKLPDVL